MLLFISGNYWKLVHGSGFQYISCYCLSQPPRHLHYQLRNFNTSHVTVYQFLPVMYNNDRTFQYISCYCLSSRRRLFNSSSAISIHLMLLFIIKKYVELLDQYKFQYISCYCLSSVRFAISRQITLFQYISCYCLSQHTYRICPNMIISIHLMLLFIFKRFLNVLKVSGFQYISCYCLSSFTKLSIPYLP